MTCCLPCAPCTSFRATTHARRARTRLVSTHARFFSCHTFTSHAKQYKLEAQQQLITNLRQQVLDTEQANAMLKVCSSVHHTSLPPALPSIPIRPSLPLFSAQFRSLFVHTFTHSPREEIASLLLPPLRRSILTNPLSSPILLLPPPPLPSLLRSRRPRWMP